MSKQRLPKTKIKKIMDDLEDEKKTYNLRRRKKMSYNELKMIISNMEKATHMQKESKKLQPTQGDSCELSNAAKSVWCPWIYERAMRESGSGNVCEKPQGTDIKESVTLDSFDTQDYKPSCYIHAAERLANYQTDLCLRGQQEDHAVSSQSIRNEKVKGHNGMNINKDANRVFSQKEFRKTGVDFQGQDHVITGDENKSCETNSGCFESENPGSKIEGQVMTSVVDNCCNATDHPCLMKKADKQLRNKQKTKEKMKTSTIASKYPYRIEKRNVGKVKDVNNYNQDGKQMWQDSQTGSKDCLSGAKTKNNSCNTENFKQSQNMTKLENGETEFSEFDQSSNKDVQASLTTCSTPPTGSPLSKFSRKFLGEKSQKVPFGYGEDYINISKYSTDNKEDNPRYSQHCNGRLGFLSKMVCFICGRGFCRYSDLEAHRLIVHNRSPNRKYKYGASTIPTMSPFKGSYFPVNRRRTCSFNDIPPCRNRMCFLDTEQTEEQPEACSLRKRYFDGYDRNSVTSHEVQTDHKPLVQKADETDDATVEGKDKCVARDDPLLENNRCQDRNLFNDFSKKVIKEEKSAILQYKYPNVTGRLYKCASCGRGFARRSDYDHHSAAHFSNMASASLTFAGSIYKQSKQKRGRPVKKSKTGPSNRKIICNVCKNSFATRTCLKVHLRIHTGERPFRCPICKHTFNQKGNLDIHLSRIHKT